MRATTMHAAWSLLLLCFSSVAVADPDPVRVSFLDGRAGVSRGAETLPLQVGSGLRVGDRVKTEAKSRLELTLPDGSKLRLSAQAEATIDAALFDGKKRERFSVKLGAGRLWSSVVKATGGEDAFQVETRNAVTGVRGTSFSVLAASDASALVRVYTGTVGVKPSAAPGGPRRQIPGPQQVSKAQWEEIVAKAMQQVKVSSAGDIAPAEAFEDSGESLAWAEWNRARDGASDPR